MAVVAIEADDVVAPPADMEPLVPVPADHPRAGGGVGFAAAMALGAFLLFLVQPLAGKFLLPSFGGGAAVWTTCMLFFQVVLLSGYAYAHFVASRLRPRMQAVVHVTLLAVAVAATWAVLPAALRGQFAPAGDAGASGLGPVGRILLVLATGAGLPCLVLSATSPLLNAWYSRSVAGSGRGIYRLYAVSNAGSLLGLLGYPLLVEPFVPRRVQAVGWAVGLGAFACVCAYCARRAAARSGAAPSSHVISASPTPRAFDKFLWLALPATASVLLLATTNTLTQDVAAVPFLWVVPLALYLVTFIVAFAGAGHDMGTTAGWVTALRPLVALAAAAVLWAMFQDARSSIVARGGVLALAMFACCVVCHGELAGLRPPAQWLTAYYLTIAAGGAVGGLLVAVVGPLVLVRYVELHIGVWACCALILVVARVRPRRVGASAPSVRTPAVSALWALFSVTALVVLGVLLWAAGTRHLDEATAVHRSRDFYGVLTVYDTHPADPRKAMRVLFHGSIVHGQQFLAPGRGHLPTAYYGPDSGIGIALRELSPPGRRRVGVVGLGAGMLASYGAAGDEFRFYEVSPNVAAVARHSFSFLTDSPARNQVVLGDARLSLEREARPHGFDVLALDAFSGDAIPVHLLTAEAFDLYRRQLAPSGVLAVHISNNHLDLEPVLRRHADEAGWSAVLVSAGGDERDGTLPADWVLMSPDSQRLSALRGDRPNAKVRPPRADDRLPRWTDEYASLLRVLR